MRRLLAAGLAALAAPATAGPARAEPRVTLLDLPWPVAEFRGPASRVATLVGSTETLREQRSLGDRPAVVVWGQGGGAALALDRAGSIQALPLGPAAADLATLERGPGAIPDGRTEASGPLTATLTGPVRTVPHAGLGSGIHAAGVTIRERKPVAIGAGAQAVPHEVTTVPAGEGAAFEDREPRLVTLAGAPAVVTVRSRPEAGSALVVIARRDGAWRVAAETPPLPEAGTWLNPAGVADFAGTGQPQIALVATPHRAGLLQLWRLEGDRLVRVAEAGGYANHVYGRAAQDLAAVADLDGDGRPDLALPTLDRAAIAFVSFAGGRIREIARVPLPARAASGVAALGAGRDLHVLVGLEDGRVADIRP